MNGGTIFPKNFISHIRVILQEGVMLREIKNPSLKEGNIILKILDTFP
jgi:hypothetical protein